jgi:hypothetical protein
LPIGWPLQNFGPLTRKPVREVAFADRWGETWEDRLKHSVLLPCALPDRVSAARLINEQRY